MQPPKPAWEVPKGKELPGVDFSGGDLILQDILNVLKAPMPKSRNAVLAEAACSPPTAKRTTKPPRERTTPLSRAEVDKIVASCQEELLEITKQLDGDDISRETRQRLERRRLTVRKKIVMASVKYDRLEECD